ncbi:hypothetical protein FP435_05645 [Lactobacillus sp. PV037]|uniref:hypothetical protein n=1 Tax=Lactobacillus sp. PV037 TaxID=2594496 RepID=UPI00223F006D|nr:hypothetical protein [Lactobacillus sp. PV037]QNQ83970.1 hypothetical protein FP435_05645 [Lactobacillus sp. PV037]
MKFRYIIYIIIGLITLKIYLDDMKKKKELKVFNFSSPIYELVNILEDKLKDLKNSDLKNKVQQEITALKDQVAQLQNQINAGILNNLEEVPVESWFGEKYQLPIKPKAELSSKQQERAEKFIQEYKAVWKKINDWSIKVDEEISKEEKQQVSE